MRFAFVLLPAVGLLVACGGSNNNQQPQSGYAQNGAYPQNGTAYPQGGTAYPQGGTAYPQGGTAYPQGGTTYPQGGTAYPQGGTAYPQGGTTTAPTTTAAPAATGTDLFGALGALIPGAGGTTAGGTTTQSGGAAAGGTAQAIDPNLAGAATAGLGALAANKAPGAAADGPAIAGNFQTGQTLEQTFTMQPGKCYTVVGSSVGIGQLDAQIVGVSPIPGVNPNFGSANGTAGMAGSQVVLGPGNNCVKVALSPVALQAKLILTASRGAGIAAAQIYVK